MSKSGLRTYVFGVFSTERLALTTSFTGFCKQKAP